MVLILMSCVILLLSICPLPMENMKMNFISPDKDVLTALDAILYELKAIHKELQDGG